jgi:phage tail-like protein
MATDKRNDPFRSFNFRVEIEGMPVMAFSEVSGLTADGDAVDYREGTDRSNVVRKLTGLRKFTMLVFKRGVIPDNSHWQWYASIANGQDDRRNGSVVLMNEAHRDVMRWNFENAWINKIEGPAMNATGNQVAIETMELVHEGLTMEVESSAA